MAEEGKVQKRIRRAFSSTEKTMMCNMFNTFKKASPTASHNNICKTVASSLGVHWVSIYKVIMEQRRDKQLKSPKRTKVRLSRVKIDEFTKCAIQNVVHNSGVKANDESSGLQTQNQGGTGEGSHDTLCCDSCRSNVAGIRQVCMQCEYTHCMSCEARGAHAHHYMLRVPGPRPEGVVRRIVKMVQMELADIISDAQPTVDPYLEPEMIKTEFEPDPLADERPSAEQLRPSILEQSMLDIVVKQEFDSDDEVVDPPDESATLQEAPSVSSDCTTTLPTTYLVPAPGESSSNKRSLSASQANATKKSFITVDAGRIVAVTVKTEPLTAEESLQTCQEAIDPVEPGVTSNKTEPRSKRGETEWERMGTAAKKKVKL